MSVTVQHAIVHITDKTKTEPVYSEAELDLAANPVVRNYFAGQVQNALADKHTGAAIFAAGGPQEAKEACARILKSQAAFIDSSQKLALRLHRALASHHWIAPGSLAVCVYTVEKDSTRFLALIKLDPSSGLVQRIGKTDDGKRVVTFDVRDNVMPTAREKLHKAALVVKEGSKPYDLLLLDRQTAPAPATFWAETFLNTVPIVDDIEGANRIKDAVQTAHENLLKSKAITPAEADAIEEHLRVALRDPELDVSGFVESLPEPAKKVVREEIEKRIPDTPTIPINVQHAAANLTNKRRYRGEFGVLFEVEDEHYDDVVTDKDTYELPNGTVVTVLTLEIPNLRWVK